MKQRRLTRYQKAVEQAAEREIEFKLNQVDYYRKVQFPCFYCGDVLKTSGVGLDRVDSNDCYSDFNTVPCCGSCNLMKGTKEQERFLIQVYKIYKTRDLEERFDPYSKDIRYQGNDEPPINGCLDGWGTHPDNLTFSEEKAKKFKR